MDPHRFDDIAHNFATGKISRRQVIKSLLFGTIGIALTGPLALLTSRQARAACSSPQPPVVIPGTCEDFRDFVKNNGAVCCDGDNLVDSTACTSAHFSIINNKATIVSHSKFVNSGRGKNKTCCVNTATVQVRFTVKTETSVLEWDKKPLPCCSFTCEGEVDRFYKDLLAHEQLHVDDANGYVRAADAAYSAKVINNICVDGNCDPKTRKEVLDMIENTVFFQAQGELINMRDNFDLRDKTKPHPFDLDCGKCKASSASTICCGDICVDYLNDATNCGSCGHSCGVGMLCQNGICGNATTCPQGTYICSGVNDPFLNCCPVGYSCNGSTAGISKCCPPDYNGFADNLGFVHCCPPGTGGSNRGGSFSCEPL